MNNYKPNLPPVLYLAVSKNLRMLLALRLKGCPAADTFDATLQAWDIAISHGKKWDAKRDLKRIEHAFAAMAGELKSWPYPSDLLERMTPHEQPEQPMLGYRYEPTAEQKQAGMERMKAILAKLDKSPVMNREWIHGPKQRSLEECIAIDNAKRQRAKQ